MADPIYVLIFLGLALALVVATTIPAPSRPVENEVLINATLLSAAVAITTLMGAFALAGLHVESVICGTIAWLTAMPCLWLARAPRPAEGWGGGEDDDYDDPLPGLDPTGAVGTGFAPAAPPAIATTPLPAPAPAGAWAMQPAAEVESQPFAAQPRLVEDAVDADPAWQAPVEPAWSAPAEPAWQTPAEPLDEPVAAASCDEPVGAMHRRALAPPARIRGDHRSIAHVNGVGAHDTGRRRRASLRLRLLECYRSWRRVTHP